MLNTDLTAYTIAKWGDWHLNPESFTPSLLRLNSMRDGVTLTGPLRVCVTVQAVNHFTLLGTSQLIPQTRDIFSYILDIPPGQSWTYPDPRVTRAEIEAAAAAAPLQTAGGVLVPPPPAGPVELAGGVSAPPPASPGGLEVSPGAVGSDSILHLLGDGSPTPASGGGLKINTNVGALGSTGTTVHLAGEGVPVGPPPPGPGATSGEAVLTPAQPARRPVMPSWSNAGFTVTIRPAGVGACADPCAPDPCDPCAPALKPHDCHCGCTPCICRGTPEDIPCDLAVANLPHLGTFFPAACEPCAPAASVGMPQLKGPTLIIPPARGGTVRTRFFNGMFITREDLETDQRNVRLKRSLMNRAMGQGVVWGLNVCLDGNAVCVLPGYAVDCCGNDVLVTTPYRVDSEALLRDPAAAVTLAGRGAHRLHLVLEYFECPEHPRPVHGDPCTPETSRCETSRIRETARLRLAPPCEVDDSGPIKDFLEEVTKLKDEPTLKKLFVTPEMVQVLAAALQPPPQVPFEVVVGLDSGDKTSSLKPLVTPNAAVDVNLPIAKVPKQVTVTVTALQGFTFVSQGTLTARDAATAPTPSATAQSLSWTAPMPASVQPNPDKTIPTPGGFALGGWVLRDAAGSQFLGSTEIELGYVKGGTEIFKDLVPGRGLLRIVIPPATVRVKPPRQPGPWPCFSEACDPQGRPRFPVTPPWLHEDPMKPGTAADPKVIVLAIVYAWLAAEMVRNKVGTPQEVQSTQLALARAIYVAAWKAFFGTVPDTEKYQLTDALQRLLQAWCRGFLYPGPTCQCSPHGAVIGCALVESGRIVSVDPWGGRRWVMHYPLLAHWGQQLGIMPFDALASKFFDLICCVGGLPAPRQRPLLPIAYRPVDVPTSPPPPPPPPTTELPRFEIAKIYPALHEKLQTLPQTEPLVGRGSTVPLPAGILVFDQPDAVGQRLTALGAQPVRTLTLNPIDFAMRAMEAFNPPAAATADAAAGPPPLVHYAIAGLPELHLLAPDVSAAATPAAATVQVSPIVRNTIAARPTPVPPLLRSFTETLSSNLLAAQPLTAATEADQPVVNTLAAAGVSTVGAALAHPPEGLHLNVLGGENAPALARTLAGSETVATSVTQAVADAVTGLANDGKIVARTDLADPALMAALSKRVVDRLSAARMPMAPEAVTAALQKSASPG